MFNKYKKIFLILSIIFIISSGLVVFAVNDVIAANAPIYDNVLKDKLQNMKVGVGLPGAQEIEDRPLDLVVRVIKMFLGLMAVIFLILILWAGFRWMTSGGNAESIDKAKGMIKASLIGILIIFFGYAITHFIFNLMNDRWYW